MVTASLGLSRLTGAGTKAQMWITMPGDTMIIVQKEHIQNIIEMHDMKTISLYREVVRTKILLRLVRRIPLRGM